MFHPDPVDLAAWQLARDAERAGRFPGIFEKKVARMAASPLSYLRGAAPLFYRLLAEHGELADGPNGKGWLCGDAHLENFGAFRADDADDEVVVFDVNDFDETVVGPFGFDVLRLSTSLILGGRELGADGVRTLSLAKRLIESYVEACFGAAAPPKAPAPVTRLLEKVERRTRREFLASRTTDQDGKRCFVIGDRYRALPPALAASATAAFEAYARGLGRKDEERFQVLDVAFRIAGTGSLGGTRVAVLTRGKGGSDGGWLFDMKEQSAPSAAALLGLPPEAPAERVLKGTRACLERPPRMMGTASLDGLSMVVRRLAPQEDKLDLSRIAPEDLESVAGYLGALLGRAHRRGAIRKPEAPWSDVDQRALVDRTVLLAGAHEAAYLAFCRRAGEVLGRGGTR
jgi:uncharacterized protein (DUF2252 family)